LMFGAKVFLYNRGALGQPVFEAARGFDNVHR
jgi:hypothetical protein